MLDFSTNSGQGHAILAGDDNGRGTCVQYGEQERQG